jgi:hypothetical protein
MNALEKRIALLLCDGYFPVQLPPSFSTVSIRGAVSALSGSFPASKIFQSECETFSVARGGHRRRTTKLPNPISQFLLARCVADNWSEIAKHLKKSKLSPTNTRLSSVAGEPILNFVYEAYDDRKEFLCKVPKAKQRSRH